MKSKYCNTGIYNETAFTPLAKQVKSESHDGDTNVDEKRTHVPHQSNTFSVNVHRQLSLKQQLLFSTLVLIQMKLMKVGSA